MKAFSDANEKNIILARKMPRLLLGLFGLLWSVLCLTTAAHTEERKYNLVIENSLVNITGNDHTAMTLNGQIPGPTLRFVEGDHAIIEVQNKMDVETSIHWHGILIPNQMDGVPNVTYPPIAPGATFPYEFDIRQTGTYWYHSHTSLQEQSGLYGSIVIEPKHKAAVDNLRDHVVLLSDWTDEDPHTILHTLKRGSEWYAIEKKSAQSILGAASVGRLSDYFSRELQRMPPMDLADVYYDTFLTNGQREQTLPAAAKEQIRLRIINGSASTYFYLEYAGGKMTIISADGQEVDPVEDGRILIGVAETYDVLVTVPKAGQFELRATAHDGSGHTSMWIGEGKKFSAPEIPSPNLYAGMGRLTLKKVFALTPAESMGMSSSQVESGQFDKPGMNGMNHEGMKMDKGMGAEHSANQDMQMQPGEMMDMGEHSDHLMSGLQHPSKPPSSWLLKEDISSKKNLAVDGMDPERPWPPYEKLRSPIKTAFDATRQVREVRLTLDGDMERYVWFINGKPLSESDSIEIKKGEVVRFIMINRSMMHHPMHLHGHFFRVLNNQGEFSPLKHTVDVAPMSTTVIEFDANEFGDWFFHCHLLYHMMSGMARVVHYEDFVMDPALAAVRPNLYNDDYYLFGQVDAMSNMAQGLVTLSNSRHIFSTEWKAGWQKVDDMQWEATPTYDYYLNRFSTLFAGGDFDGATDVEKHVGVFGFRYLVPLNLESRSWVDTEGNFQFALGRKLDLTPRIKPFAEFEFDTASRWENRAGLSYIISRDTSLIGQWHSEFGWGAGVEVRF